jgi:hypothetical protein
MFLQTCTIKQVPIESELAPQTACLRFPKDAPHFYQYSRITVTMDDAAQSHQLVRRMHHNLVLFQNIFKS